MSEDQQLISRYTRDLSLSSSAFYMLHFLKITKDDPAIRMLKDSLTQIQKETKSEQLNVLLSKNEFSSNTIKALGRHDPNFDPESKLFNKFTYENTAKMLLSKLQLEDALKIYTKSVHEIPSNGKYYKERSEIYLLLNNYKKALSLSSKGLLDDIFLASAIADGNFSIIQNRFENFIRIIAKNLFNFKKSVMGRYEYEILLVMVSFARMSSTDLKIKTDIIFENSAYNHNNLKEMVNLFYNRQFPQFLEKIPEIEAILNLSLYSSPSCSKFIDAIKENILINEVSPFSLVYIDNVHTKLNIPILNIKRILIKAIQDKKLNGKLDLKKNVFIGGIADLQDIELEQLYNRSVNALQSLQLAMWIKQYNKKNTPKREQLILSDKLKNTTKVEKSSISKIETSTDEKNVNESDKAQQTTIVSPNYEKMQDDIQTTQNISLIDSKAQNEGNNNGNNNENNDENEEDIFFYDEGDEDEK
ncbi:hypothetical protein M9Y10_026808 [Tritrichomonas musculus]|uniref:PCI domain-containing protein n=1 Tax=Tritrichomonas musculus TaxID=1915356 RepID=A0ABR2H6S4_9EUKA